MANLPTHDHSRIEQRLRRDLHETGDLIPGPSVTSGLVSDTRRLGLSLRAHRVAATVLVAGAVVLAVVAILISPALGRAVPSGSYRPPLPPDTIEHGCYPLPRGLTLDFPYQVRADGDVVAGLVLGLLLAHLVDLLRATREGDPLSVRDGLWLGFLGITIVYLRSSAVLAVAGMAGVAVAMVLWSAHRREGRRPLGAAVLPAAAAAGGDQLVAVLVKVGILSLLTQPFVHLAGSRYWTTAGALGGLAVVVLARTAWGAVRREPPDPGDETSRLLTALQWLITAVTVATAATVAVLAT